MYPLKRTFSTLFTDKSSYQYMQSDPLSRDVWGISRSAGEYETFQSAHSRLHYRGRLRRWQGSRQLPFLGGGKVIAFQGGSDCQGNVLPGDRRLRLPVAHLVSCSCPLCLRLKLLLGKALVPKAQLQTPRKIPRDHLWFG